MSKGRPATDDELVAQGLAGSREALAELYRRYRPRVFGYVFHITGERDLAEEVFCATFATFFENLERYQPSGRLASYLLRIARSRLMDELKARGRLSTPFPDESATAPTLRSAAAGPEDAAASAELAERAHRALAELPDHLREVVVLRLHEGLAYADIAEILAVGEATVRSRMRYALQALRRAIEPIPEK
jgi:RNA polymerase sigma-70 factor, ECF subfamily